MTIDIQYNAINLKLEMTDLDFQDLLMSSGWDDLRSPLGNGTWLNAHAGYRLRVENGRRIYTRQTG